MSSWQSRASIGVLRLARRRRHFRSAEALRKTVERRDRKGSDVRPPSSLAATAEEFKGWPLHRVPAAASREMTVLYLHGGAYIGEIIRPHWDLIAGLVAGPAECVVPHYPLAPQGQAEEVTATAAVLLAETVERSKGGRTILMGDSAGGGLALAATQRLRDQGGPMPSRILLISPWLDVTMSDPGQAAIEPSDPMLMRPGLAEAGRLYAGDLSTRDPKVSPLFGTFEGLPPITALCGTRDLLVTDSRALVRAAEPAGVKIDYHEAEGQPHAYPLFPTPEGHTARRQITRACRT